MRLRLPASLHNWISLAGIVVATGAFFTDLIMLIVAVFLFPGGDFYVGLFMYIVLPSLMVAGLLMIPLGMYLKRRKDKREGTVVDQGWPCIDLNTAKHRKAFVIFASLTAVYLLFTAVGSYEAFHVTESVDFCGKLCHSVMKPQYTLYYSSPHAKVPCASCHVGPGASWFVRSKLSGATQIINTIKENYPKPLPTAISNLRPARDVCEQCHWPEKFYTHDVRLERKYLSDEANTPWELRLVLKVGSEHAVEGLKEGIHWHINPDIKIEYLATDPARQNIPWVRATNLKTGEAVVYTDRAGKVDEAVDEDEVRIMDCMDCHNMPSHEFMSPARFVTNAMISGDIPLDLPKIKDAAMAACAEEYATDEDARKGISEFIHRYYKRNFPEVYDDKDDEIDKAVLAVQQVFEKNIFPEMKASWRAYPNNIGHREFKGCFRCHNDTHASDKGDVIRKDCNICHFINAQGTPPNVESATAINESLEFRHPTDVGVAWKEGLCTDCHTGLNP